MKFIKRWEQEKFNFTQILDTQAMLKSPTFIKFNTHLLFSLNNNHCTFYLSEETYKNCGKWGKWFYRKPLNIEKLYDYIVSPLTIAQHIPTILELYFLTEPEFFSRYTPEHSHPLTTFSKHEIKLLETGGYLKNPKQHIPSMEFLRLFRLLLRFKWEKHYTWNPCLPMFPKTGNFLLEGGNMRETDQFKTKCLKNKELRMLRGWFQGDELKGNAVIVNEYDKTTNKTVHDQIIILSNCRPSIVHFLDKALAFIAEEGGMTSHAVQIAIERNMPCVIGASGAMKKYQTGDAITINFKEGVIK